MTWKCLELWCYASGIYQQPSWFMLSQRKQKPQGVTSFHATIIWPHKMIPCKVVDFIQLLLLCQHHVSALSTLVDCNLAMQLAIFLSLYHNTRVDAAWFRFSDNHQSSEHLNHQQPHFSNSNGLQPSSRDPRDKLTARKAPTEVVKPKLEEAREMMSCLIGPFFKSLFILSCLIIELGEWFARTVDGGEDGSW